MVNINKTERKILNISLPPEIYREVEKLSKDQSKAKSEFVREVLSQYIASDKRWKQIRKWGKESVRKLRIKSEKDVEILVEQYREDISP